MINNSSTLTKIAKVLDMRKSHVSYYIRKAKENGYISEVCRDRIKIFELTQQGKNFIDQYDKRIQNKQLACCRAENIRFKASVHRLPVKTPDWHKVEMNNWSQYKSTVDNIRVKLNMGNSPTIKFLPSPIDGSNPWELCGILYHDCTEAAGKVEQTLDMEIGRLGIESGAEWVVYDPVANVLCKHNGQLTIEGRGKVNASKPSRRGAIEYFDIRRAAEYFAMPERVSRIERQLEQLSNHFKEKDGL